jgi:hypothetical protein
LFVVNAPLRIMAFVLALRYVPESADPPQPT